MPRVLRVLRSAAVVGLSFTIFFCSTHSFAAKPDLRKACARLLISKGQLLLRRHEVEAAVVANLTPDLLKGEWREKNAHASSSVTGHCYVASEALFHLLGGKS